MSNLYQDLDLTVFPDAVDKRKIMVDPSSEDDLVLINQFNDLIRSGNIPDAVYLLDQNSRLADMCFSAETWNRHEDMIIAIQRFWQSNIRQYLVDIVKFRGEYRPEMTYQKYDVVLFPLAEGYQAYIAIANDIPAGTPITDSSCFAPLTLRGERGVTGTGLAWRGVYDPLTVYHHGDCVSHNNRLWASAHSEGHSGNEPAEALAEGEAVYWEPAFRPETTIYANTILEDELRRFVKIGRDHAGKVICGDENGDVVPSAIDVSSLWHKGNLSAGTADPAGGNDGDIYFKIVG